MPATLWSRLTHWLSPHQPPSPARRTPAAATAPASPQEAKQLRATHREQLFAAVRENMIRAGILSGSYKFKALTLDKSGTTFIVMFDILSVDLPSDPDTLGHLEKNLQTLTQNHLGLTVKAVYWRHAIDNPTAPAPQGAADPAFAKTIPLIRSSDELYTNPLSDTQMGKLE